jgi:5-formyltetrahydrofolate cyclo-ligase
MIKKELRNIYQQLRHELEPEKMLGMTYDILSQFRQLQLPAFHYLLTYAPLISKKEFEVSYCTSYLVENNPGLKMLWPRILPGNRMDAILPDTVHGFSFNKYNIAEPASGRVLDPVRIDCVFVPLLAFDIKGYRVGYGKGYYDRFFARCRKDVLKIGFSFFEAEQPIDDIDQFDVPLNYCITPMRTYEF